MFALEVHKIQYQQMKEVYGDLYSLTWIYALLTSKEKEFSHENYPSFRFCIQYVISCYDHWKKNTLMDARPTRAKDATESKGNREQRQR